MCNQLSTQVNSKELSGIGLQKMMFSYVYVMSLQEFEKDVSEFNQRVEDLDRRLGTVFTQAFDDAPALEHAFKVRTGAGPPEEGRQTLPAVLLLQRSVAVHLVDRHCGLPGRGRAQSWAPHFDG